MAVPRPEDANATSPTLENLVCLPRACRLHRRTPEPIVASIHAATMTTPFTGLFIDASCNSRFSHVKETDPRYRIMFVDSENNTFSFQSNNGDLVPLKPLGINHVHRPTHAPQAPVSVNQGVSITTHAPGTRVRWPPRQTPDWGCWYVHDFKEKHHLGVIYHRMGCCGEGHLNFFAIQNRQYSTVFLISFGSGN
jgi:hypothetical protein